MEENTTERGEGLRYNQGKQRWDLLHTVAQEGIVRVLTKGSIKYQARNWERGMSWTSIIASMKRHMAAFERGEDYDPETGELHVDHIQCNAHFLSAFYKIFPQGDDRAHSYLKNVKIGVDIDEVLCNWVGDWTRLEGLQTPYHWNFDRTIVEKFDAMKIAGTLDKFYLELAPLMEGKDMPFEPHCYITSRPVGSEVTEAWLDVHGFPTRPVYSTGLNMSKVDIAKREGIDIMIDDGYHNFLDLNRAGICCFLYDAPHNQKYDV